MTAAEAERYGLTVEEASGPPVEVWPDNWTVVQLFMRVSTQWRCDMGGPIGLDYNVVFRFMDRMKLSDEQFDLLITDIGVMEDAALAKMREKT